MKLTHKARTVLSAVMCCKDGCGANFIAKAMGMYAGKTTPLIAGGYAGRLCRAGWLAKEDEWYTNGSGGQSYMGVRYWITAKGRNIIRFHMPLAAAANADKETTNRVKGETPHAA